MSDEIDDWVGPKRGGKYRHVKPNGTRIDDWRWWYCPRCGWARERAVTKSFTVLWCIGAHPIEARHPSGSISYDYERIELQPIPVGVDIEVYEAALLCGGSEAGLAVIEDYLARK